ncbi:MAG: restriction endonuclease subunit M [Candidatus Dactylopiibacterium carminicum]|uniref:site-specific DNA-methyltransferase (adenine-specific) n=2 Tax=Candidatus Dactylopiibacterium carminicum TaxID=857335 RepID=A0A272EPQ3_9RHOO|nr:restriction endonuclease subunit M [Candidatus Dactylopiibacterium carminicum]PAS91670.1 MAG: restriction endonuclease subunit M [Candidatus Dactylopiibacterium carminicum]PAS96564.1 MAG: restriction endonuclease subunit M [Candidatus Dactylopiibacterium carminicum]PAT00775.1 MAG: restriction endonuclease subunit M [Candidatus Dactylopiibacterium carminicum]
MPMQAKPLVPWIGGKRRLAKHILPLFPEHTCYVEPFCGAAALYFLKPPAKAEVLNDINGELINLYRVVKHHPEEFARQFKWALTSRQIYEWAKVSPPEPLTDVQRASRFYYLQKCGFGGKVEGQTFGTATTSAPRLSFMRLEDDIAAAHLRLVHAYIEHLPWAACISRYDREHTLFYCDPPYWGTEGYGFEFGLDEYTHIANLARSIKGRMVISVNDIPEMRQAFSGLTMERVEINYQVGGSGRSKARSGELIIRNW